MANKIKKLKDGATFKDRTAGYALWQVTGTCSECGTPTADRVHGLAEDAAGFDLLCKHCRQD